MNPSRKINIMVVDDSAIVRGLIVRQLSQVPNFHVVASLANGEMAVSAIRHHEVDVVVLDIEMPVMDGMTALPKLIAHSPRSRIIMASTLTLRNADISLRALEMGAADYIPKPSLRDDKDALDKFYRDLVAKIYALAPAGGRSANATSPTGEKSTASTQSVRHSPAAPVSAPPVHMPPAAQSMPMMPAQRVKALAIASSTGGPQALMDIFRALKGELTQMPIFITQHMPKTFTKILAEHLTQACGRDCHEGVDGERVENGKIYLAPGDYHMVPQMRGGDVVIHLNQKPEVNFCRPAADPMIDGLADAYGKHLMLLVLTGMGQDGYAAARRLYDAGGTVIAQDKETCVVWGMPKAVTEQHLCRAVLPLPQIAGYLMRACSGGGA